MSKTEGGIKLERSKHKVAIGEACVHCGGRVIGMSRKIRREYERKWHLDLTPEIGMGAHCPRCRVPYKPDGLEAKKK